MQRLPTATLPPLAAAPAMPPGAPMSERFIPSAEGMRASDPKMRVDRLGTCMSFD